jgi:hypothetical protein
MENGELDTDIGNPRRVNRARASPQSKLQRAKSKEQRAKSEQQNSIERRGSSINGMV